MPRATENDPLPYESSAFQAAIARRVAQMEAKDRRRGAKRKAGAIALAIAILWMLWSIIPSHAYETGKMSCRDIGQFAAAIAADRDRGKTFGETIAFFSARFQGPEYKVMEDITAQLFKGPFTKMTPQGAGIAYMTDCLVQK
jgi:hypothetical protein